MTTPEVSAIRDADRIIGLLEAGGLRNIQLIINRLRPEMIARGDMMSVDDVIEILAVDLIGTILDDEQIVIASNQGEPLSGKKSQAEEEYRNICRRILGEEVPFMEIRQKKGMFRRLGEIFANRNACPYQRRGSCELFFAGKKPFRRVCERQNEASSCLRTDWLFSADDDHAEKRSDTYGKEIYCH